MWIKHFLEHPVERGTDKDIKEGLASWRNGRLDNMVGVEITEDWGYMNIFSFKPQEYWQSDDYESTLVNGSTILTRRRIQMKLNSYEPYIHIYNSMIGGAIKADQAPGTSALEARVAPKRLQTVDNEIFFMVDNNTVGKWLTLEMSPREYKWYITEAKI
jgi:hypothetical protein